LYAKIMVPVDLAHVDRLSKAIDTATDLAKRYQIPVCFVGVTPSTPSPVAHNPQEFARKLDAFAQAQGAEHGLDAGSAAYISDDPAVDLDRTLMDAIAEQGADLVVMASHIPGLPEYLFHSNAGHLAAHAKVSVFVVR
jgi:nucleotide-binding universal stress UspA family protein